VIISRGSIRVVRSIRNLPSTSPSPALRASSLSECRGQDILGGERTTNCVAVRVAVFPGIGCAFGVSGAANNADCASLTPSPIILTY
jgi:hypothetical protein